MASTALQAQRFVKIINQQLDVLKEERNTVIRAVDQCINQVQSEVDVWVNEGLVNQTTCGEMSNRIQKVISLLIEKYVELEGVAVGTDASHNITTRFAILEEAVYSLKKTTEKVEDKIENIDKILKDVSTQHVNDHTKIEILINAKLTSEKKLRTKMTDLGKRYQDISSNTDDLFETVSNVEEKLNRLEYENNSANASMNELNEQISSVRTCSNDALVSIQDLSKSVESTNQHYNELSNKLDQLEISINLMSSQYTEQFENMGSLNKDKADDLKDSIENRVAEMSNKITDIELKVNLPKVGFCAIKKQSEKAGLCPISSYDQLDRNHGGHFDQATGIFTAPLNGLYVITVKTFNQSKTKTRTFSCFRCQDKLGKLKLLHRVTINQTVTRCAEIAAGDKLYLEWETVDENDKNCIFIYFSCYMIPMWP